MSILDSSVRHGASRVISSMLMMACMCPVLAQDSAPAQPDALDFTPPLLKDVDVVGSVNAQALNQYVNVTIKLTDNLSGVASFVMDNQDVATIKAVIVRDVLHGVDNALFYLYNGCGQQLSYSSNPITLKVTPLTVEDV
jgi:hypothetical protein